MIYDFYTQLNMAKVDEYKLDRLFANWYQVEEIPLDMEMSQDIDRLFIRPDGTQILVEYKIDYKSDVTGNLAIELISNDVSGAAGWAYTTHADMLVFYRKGNGEVVVVRTDMFRAAMSSWSNRYHRVHVKNRHYCSICLIVPISEVRRLAEWSIYIEHDSH